MAAGSPVADVCAVGAGGGVSVGWSWSPELELGLRVDSGRLGSRVAAGVSRRKGRSRRRCNLLYRRVLAHSLELAAFRI